MLTSMIRSTIAGALSASLLLAPVSTGFLVASTDAAHAKNGNGNAFGLGNKPNNPGNGNGNGNGKDKLLERLEKNKDKGKSNASAKGNANAGNPVPGGGSNSSNEKKEKQAKIKANAGSSAPKEIATPANTPTIYGPGGQILVLGISPDVTRNAPSTSPRPPERPRSLQG